MSFMKLKGRWKKIVLGLLLILMVLVILGWLGAKRYIESGALVQLVERKVQEFAGTGTSIGTIQLEEGPKVRIADVRLEYPDGEPFVSVGTILVGFRWHDLLARRVSSVRIESASLALRLDDQGNLDIPALKHQPDETQVAEKKPSESPSIPRIEIVDSSVRLLYGSVDAEARIERLNFKRKFTSGFELLSTVTLPDVAEQLVLNADLPSDFDILKKGKLELEIPRLDLRQLSRLLTSNEIMEATVPISGTLSGSISYSSGKKVAGNFRLDELGYERLRDVFGSLKVHGTLDEKDNRVRFDSSLEVNRMEAAGENIVRQSEKPLDLYADGTLKIEEGRYSVEEIQWRMSPVGALKIAKAALPDILWRGQDIAGTVALRGVIRSKQEMTVLTSIQDGRFNNLHGIYSDLETHFTLSEDRRLLIEDTTEILKGSLGNRKLISKNRDGLKIETTTTLDFSPDADPVQTIHFDLPDIRLEDFQPFLDSSGQGEYALAGHGRFSGEVNTAGRGSVSGRIEDASFGPIFKSDLNIDITSFWTDEEAEMTVFSGNLRTSEMFASGYDIVPATLDFVAEYQLDIGDISIRTGNLDMKVFQSPVSGSLYTQGDNLVDLSFDLPEMDINELFALPEKVIGTAIPLPQTDGRIDPRFELGISQMGRGLEILVRNEGGFEGASGSGLDDIALWSEVGGKTSGTVSLVSDTPGIQFSQDITLDQGELLYDTLYQNLADSPFEIDIPHGTYSPDGTVRVQGATFVMPNIALIEASGTIGSASPYPFDLDLRMDTIWQRFLPEVVVPWLSGGTDLFEGSSGDGSLSFQSRIFGDGNWQTVDGTIESEASLLAFPKIYDASFSGLSIDIPLRIHLGGRQSETSEPVEIGQVSFKQFATRYFTIGEFSFPVHIEDNRLNIPERLVVPMYGGDLVLSAFSMEDILEKTSRIYGRLEIRGLNLTQVTDDLGLPAMEGEISGDNLELESDEGDLRILSPLMISIFGGTIEITELRWLDFFGRYPTFEISTDIKELNLGKLSGKLSIGQITGILNGRIQDLRIQSGWPIEFEVDMETVKKSGVSQQVSSDAVKTMLMVDPRTLEEQAIRQILERTDLFYYDKIGLHASLHRNVFKLVGTIKKGGVDYLMLGGGWKPLNITVQRGDQGVYFREYVKDLMKHVESVQKEGNMVVE